MLIVAPPAETAYTGSMPSSDTLLLFSATALVLLAVPGPAVMYIVTRGLAGGRNAGLVSVLGIHAGTGIHVLAATLGLSALLAASAEAFLTVKLAGAAYLVYLGIRTLRRARTGQRIDGDVITRRPTRQVFVDGFWVSALNPKVAVFFLAFVPQFVVIDAGDPRLQILALGAAFIVLGLLTDGAYALAAGWFGDRLTASSRLSERMNIVAGSTYIGLGVMTAVVGGSSE